MTYEGGAICARGWILRVLRLLYLESVPGNKRVSMNRDWVYMYHYLTTLTRQRSLILFGPIILHQAESFQIPRALSALSELRCLLSYSMEMLCLTRPRLKLKELQARRNFSYCQTNL